jgi:hypothetical protein
MRRTHAGSGDGTRVVEVVDTVVVVVTRGGRVVGLVVVVVGVVAAVVVVVVVVGATVVGVTVVGTSVVGTWVVGTWVVGDPPAAGAVTLATVEVVTPAWAPRVEVHAPRASSMPRATISRGSAVRDRTASP